MRPRQPTRPAPGLRPPTSSGAVLCASTHQRCCTHILISRRFTHQALAWRAAHHAAAPLRTALTTRRRAAALLLRLRARRGGRARPAQRQPAAGLGRAAAAAAGEQVGPGRAEPCEHGVPPRTAAGQGPRVRATSRGAVVDGVKRLLLYKASTVRRRPLVAHPPRHRSSRKGGRRSQSSRSQVGSPDTAAGKPVLASGECQQCAHPQ